MEKKEKLTIVVDTREQRPLDFSAFPDVETLRGTLATGDYSVFGFTTEIVVERKSLDDLIGCLTHDRERFTAELQRLRGYASALLVVESPFDAIRRGQYHSRMNPEAAVQSVFSIMQKFRLPFYFADSREDTAFAVHSFLKHFVRHEAERSRRFAVAVGAVC